MKKILFSLLTLSIAGIKLIYGQDTAIEKGLQSISTDVIMAQLEFLASDWTEGREGCKRSWVTTLRIGWIHMRIW